MSFKLSFVAESFSLALAASIDVSLSRIIRDYELLKQLLAYQTGQLLSISTWSFNEISCGMRRLAIAASQQHENFCLFRGKSGNFAFQTKNSKNWNKATSWNVKNPADKQQFSACWNPESEFKFPESEPNWVFSSLFFFTFRFRLSRLRGWQCIRVFVVGVINVPRFVINGLVNPWSGAA
jgi:hypothetical protein